MLFSFPYLAEWKAIMCKCQYLVNDDIAEKIENLINHDYTIGDQVLIINGSVNHKAKDRQIGPFPMI